MALPTPKRRIRGIRESIPSGHLLGRISNGEGDVELISLETIAQGVASSGLVATGGSTGAVTNGMLPLVTGDTTPGNGPFPITDINGQYIGVPL